MRFFALLLVLALSFGGARAQYNDEQYYVMADSDSMLDAYDFDVMGGAMMQPQPVLLPQAVSSKYQQPVQVQWQQSIQQAPITLPIQQATRELITLPVLHSTEQPINLAPQVTNKYIEQPITQYRYIEQPVIQPRLIEQPKLQQRFISQPVYRQIVTQPVYQPRITTQPIINQRFIDQPIIQHRLIEQPVIQPQLIEVPVTNKAQTAQAIHLEAQPITNEQRFTAQPIMRNAPTLQQAPITNAMLMPQQPVLSGKKGGAAYGQQAPVYGGALNFGGQFNQNQQQQPVLGGMGMDMGAQQDFGGQQDNQQFGGQY